MSTTYWTDGANSPEAGRGVTVRTMVMDGRVLEERVSADLMGRPFEGIGHSGFDNVVREYWITWMDTMGTGVAVFRGEWDPDTGSLVFRGETSNPDSGRRVAMRIVSRRDGDDREISTFFAADPAGTMHKTMEVVYDRVKE